MTEATAGPYSRAAGRIIRRARKNAGLSLAQAAAKSGKFSAPAMWSWEAGERGLTIDRAVEVAKLLGIPPASLMPREPADGVDEEVAAGFTLLLENAGLTRKLGRMLATAHAALPGRVPTVLNEEPTDSLILLDREVDLLEAIVLSLRAQQRERDAIPTVDEPDGAP